MEEVQASPLGILPVADWSLLCLSVKTLSFVCPVSGRFLEVLSSLNFSPCFSYPTPSSLSPLALSLPLFEPLSLSLPLSPAPACHSLTPLSMSSMCLWAPVPQVACCCRAPQRVSTPQHQQAGRQVLGVSVRRPQERYGTSPQQ